MNVHLEPVRRRVRRAELAHPERGGHVRREQARAHGDSLVRVQVHVQRPPAQSLRERLLDERDARRAADHLHRLDVLERDAVLREPLQDGLQRRRGARADARRLRELLKLRALDRAPEVVVLVHALHGDGCLLVGAQNLFGLAHLLAQLADGARRRQRRRRGLVRRVEFGGEMVHQHHVHVLSAARLVPRHGLDLELTVRLLLSRLLAVERAVPHQRGAHARRAHVVHDGPRTFGRELLVDAPLQSRGAEVGNLREDVQTRDVRGVVQRVAVGLAEVRGDRDDGILRAMVSRSGSVSVSSSNGGG